MDHLIVAIFKRFVAPNIIDIEMRIKTEPLFILPLVGYLDQMSAT